MKRKISLLRFKKESNEISKSFTLLKNHMMTYPKYKRLHMQKSSPEIEENLGERLLEKNI